MNLEELKYILSESVEELPGWNSHEKLSPPYRERYDIEMIKRTNPRAAAVMILLYENELGDIEFPVTMRVSYDGTHSNQFSLPGGQFEESDISFDLTAVRETVEELGVFDEDIEVVKQLSEIFIPPSNFLVYPFIGVHHGQPNFIPEEAEVEYVIPLDLEAFLDAEPETFVKEFSGQKVDIPGYNIGDEEYIWGATAMILEEFKDVLKNHLNY
ncbi:NUDIX hydrolase [Faecalibacter bovis]|uniref:CoA pyrophosphatase n=1 Tax=Faecalibacter bovis TaxID=2898187 RepID=A0ABX7XDI4_9FLAO|nr:CoA pyrophosphatase [Faecalibacter bovis]MBS7332987.1 CoA pyrophosphatase [Weeksellaceae bacterium]QTV05947.1 CoA pyrophosphatase [Faecalibacter bovis]